MLIHGCHVSVSLSLSHFFVSEYALMAVGIREQPEWEKTRTDERKKITRHKILDTRGATYARGINWIQLSQLIRIHSHTLTTGLLLTYSAGLLSYPACTLVYAASPFVPPHPPSNLLRHPSFFFSVLSFFRSPTAIARSPFLSCWKVAWFFFYVSNVITHTLHNLHTSHAHVPKTKIHKGHPNK